MSTFLVFDGLWRDYAGDPEGYSEALKSPSATPAPWSLTTTTIKTYATPAPRCAYCSTEHEAGRRHCQQCGAPYTEAGR